MLYYLHNLLETSPRAALRALDEQLQEDNSQQDNSRTDFHAHDRKSEKHTLLQLSAKNGYIEILLKLLLKTNVQIDFYKPQTDSKKSDCSILIDKPPLYLAIEHEQWLAANILLLFGANRSTAYDVAVEKNEEVIQKKLDAFAIDSDVALGVLLWVLIHLEENDMARALKIFCKEKLIPQESKARRFSAANTRGEKKQLLLPLLPINRANRIESPVGLCGLHRSAILEALIRFAAFTKQFTMARHLFELNNEAPTTQLTPLTYSYWAALAKEEGHLFLGDDRLDDHYVRATLSQLKHDKEAFTLFCDKITSAQKEGFFERSLKASEEKVCDSELTKAARKHDNVMLSHYAKVAEVDEWLAATLTDLARDNDWVGIFAVCQAFKPHKVFSYCLKQKNRQLFFLTMFLTNTYFYQLLFVCPKRQAEIAQLIGENISSGLLHRMVNRALLSKTKDMRESREISIQQKYFKEIQVNEEYFLKVYFKHAGIDPELIPLQQKAVIYEQIGRFGLEDEKRFVLVSNINRLFVSGPGGAQGSFLSPFVKYPFMTERKGPSGIVMSFLSLQEKAKCARTCQFFYNLGRDDNLIRQLLSRLENKLNNTSYFTYRHYFNVPKVKAAAMVTAASVLTFASSLYLNVKYSSFGALGRVQDALQNDGCVPLLPNKKDYDYSQCGTYNNSDICEMLCDEYNDPILKLKNIGLLLLLGFSFLGSLSLPHVIWQVKDTWGKGREHFDNVPLNVFAPELEVEARRVFSALPDSGLTVSSPLYVVMEILKREGARKRDTNDQECKIEVEEVSCSLEI